MPRYLATKFSCDHFEYIVEAGTGISYIFWTISTIPPRSDNLTIAIQRLSQFCTLVPVANLSMPLNSYPSQLLESLTIIITCQKRKRKYPTGLTFYSVLGIASTQHIASQRKTLLPKSHLFRIRKQASPLPIIAETKENSKITNSIQFKTVDSQWPSPTSKTFKKLLSLPKNISQF